MCGNYYYCGYEIWIWNKAKWNKELWMCINKKPSSCQMTIQDPSLSTIVVIGLIPSLTCHPTYLWVKYLDMVKYLWVEFVLTAAYLTNRMTGRMLNYSSQLNVSHKSFPDYRWLSDLHSNVLALLSMFTQEDNLNLILVQSNLCLWAMLLIIKSVTTVIIQ